MKDAPLGASFTVPCSLRPASADSASTVPFRAAEAPHGSVAHEAAAQELLLCCQAAGLVDSPHTQQSSGLSWLPRTGTGRGWLAGVETLVAGVGEGCQRGSELVQRTRTFAQVGSQQRRWCWGAATCSKVCSPHNSSQPAWVPFGQRVPP